MVSIIFIIFIAVSSDAQEILQEEVLFPVDISGKIVDKDGKLFTEEVTLNIYSVIWHMDLNTYDIQEKEADYQQKVSGGYFQWKGASNRISVSVEREGYHEDNMQVPDSVRIIEEVDGYPTKYENEIIAKDIILHMIPKGVSSRLEYVGGAEIPDKNDKKSGGRECGWSFKKLWYFPVAEEETVWMTMSLDEKGNSVYTMKEPGGFVLFRGYPKYESKPDRLFGGFNWMTQAPESGYVQTVNPEKDKIDNKIASSPYYYFRTPDGKYGKITFPGLFTYYLNPSGSRDLEAGEVKELGPVNPSYQEWLDEWEK